MMWMVLVSLVACGPDKAMLEEKDRLEVRAADLEKANSRLEKEAETYKKRIGELEKQVKANQDTGIWDKLGLKKDQALSVTFKTTLGDIRCELWPKVAPNTVLNFVELAEGTKEWEDPRTGKKVKQPLYDGTTFHRVIPGFMIQGGDPLGTGTGGPGYRFADETDPSVTFDRKGLLAMANAGPDTNGSQFFITDSLPTHLNGKHTIFGDCSKDNKVTYAISQVARDARDKPVTAVVVKKAAIERGR